MTARKTLLYIITAAVFLSAAVASAQYCNCVYRTNNGTATKCLPSLPTFSCDDTCKSDLSPGVGVQSATPVVSCSPPPKQHQPPPPQLSAYQRLVQGALYTIGHEGFTPYIGPDSDVLLSGQALRNFLYQGQGGARQNQAATDIRDASLSDIEKATAEALMMCKERHVDALQSLAWVWGHEGQGATMKRDAAAKNYQGIRDVHNQFEHDVKLKNLLACFNGPEIQSMVDQLSKDQPPPPPSPPKKKESERVQGKSRNRP